jgi:hypothetical protein
VQSQKNKGKKKASALAQNRILQLKEDDLLIKRMLRDHPNVTLIVLDPLTGYFGEADQNKDKEIRPVLESIVAAIEKSRAALVGIVHHNKKADVDAIGKVLGGSAIVGIARAVWAFSRDREAKTEFYMALVKGNLSKKRTGIKYGIDDVEVPLPDDRTTKAPFIVWKEESDLDANDLLDLERDRAKNGGKKLMDACSLLIQSENQRPGPARWPWHSDHDRVPARSRDGIDPSRINGAP